MRFWDWIRKIFPWWMRYYNRFEVRGINNLPKEGSAIIALNHSGGLDLDNFCIMSALEQFKTDDPTRKRIWLCYWDKWSIGENLWAYWVQKFSPIPINLTGKGIPFNLVDKIIKRGELIAITPEGHSAALYEGYRLWKFYPGVIKLHLRYKIPIIPTASIGFVKAAPILTNHYNHRLIPPWERELMFPFIFPYKLIFHFGKGLMYEEYFNRNVSKEMMFNLAQDLRIKVKDMISLYRRDITRSNPFGVKTGF
ncbi:MAG: lysophospholipid acyltransferase family protein [Candidatus Thorarchaeota archaeon]